MAPVGSEDHEAPIALHPPRQLVSLDVGVAVVTIPHLDALAEESICLVEEQNRSPFPGLGEDLSQVLLGLADVLGHDSAQVDAEATVSALGSNHRSGHGLAGSGRPREQPLR